MKKYFYLLVVSLCLGLAACGDDDENDGVVPPTTQNGNTQQTLPDPEGTVTTRITNDGDYNNGININGSFVYLDKVNNLCVKKSNEYPPMSASIADLGKVAGLSAISKIPEEGFSDKVATSEGDGLILRLSYQRQEYHGQEGFSYYAYVYYYRFFLAEYLRDALGNIIGATIKYQTVAFWEGRDTE